MVLSTIFLVYIFTGSFPTRAEPLLGLEVKKAEKGKYSYVVSLALRHDAYPQERLHFCAGVLITNKFVLTAAHCITNKSLNTTQLVLGSVDLRAGKKYDPRKWITYNQWAESQNITIGDGINDIALIKLWERVRSRVSKPAAIMTMENHQLYDEYVVLVGWGLSNESPDRPTRYLRQAEVKVLPNVVCENIVYDLVKTSPDLDDRYMCSKGEPHALTAAGDSGGPVLLKNKVVGINKGGCPAKNSFCDLAEEVIHKHQINIHTSTYFYRQFIDDVLNNY